MRQCKAEVERTVLSPEKLAQVDEYRERFLAALAADLDTPTAVALLWEVAKSNVPGQDKYDLLAEFDEVLALGLVAAANAPVVVSAAQANVPAEVQKLLDERVAAREAKDWAKADELRDAIAELGFQVKDGAAGVQELAQL